MGHLGPRMNLTPASQLWVRCKDCFAILHNKRGQERDMEIILMVLHSNFVILEQKWYGVLLTLNLLSGFFTDFTQ